MSDDKNPTIPPTGEGNTGPDPQKSTDTVDVAALLAERDKWKAMSKKHEKDYETASKKLSEFEQAAMSESEKAIEKAKAEARTQTLSEVGSRLVEAELKVQAAKAGVSLPDDIAEVLNLSKLVDENGHPNATAIAKVIGSFAPADDGGFPPVGGIGPQHGKGGQLSQKDLQSMHWKDIAQAKRDGRLNNLLGIE
ncbi:hypothetical protein [Nonomuraea recticatena]|uniref:Scaffolding protein n=1 Tax=Nonomuraea recticatena TaxID=46178 RepID=A0ABP6ECQ6_9ACTN